MGEKYEAAVWGEKVDQSFKLAHLHEVLRRSPHDVPVVQGAHGILELGPVHLIVRHSEQVKQGLKRRLQKNLLGAP